MSALKSILIAFFMVYVSTSFGAAQQKVNAILGDVSYIQKFGYAPNENTNEQIRIQTHLEFVESILRVRDVSKMPKALRENRNKMLNLLHDYWTRAEFPVNYDHSGTRIPCFIDKDSSICAVGYLIEKTAGRDVAEKINADFKYAEIYAMKDPLVANWITSSGLSKLECAMIQPTYEYRNYDTPFDPILPTLPSLPPPQVSATRNDLAVKKRMDSLVMLTYFQSLKIDSLSNQIKTINDYTDSVVNINQQKDQELTETNQEYVQNINFLTTVIWVLSILIGFGAFMFALKLLNSKQV
jgi:hypothetical protein